MRLGYMWWPNLFPWLSIYLEIGGRLGEDDNAKGIRLYLSLWEGFEFDSAPSSTTISLGPISIHAYDYSWIVDEEKEEW